jgi:hypothetical protein
MAWPFKEVGLLDHRWRIYKTPYSSFLAVPLGAWPRSGQNPADGIPFAIDNGQVMMQVDHDSTLPWNELARLRAALQEKLRRE